MTTIPMHSANRVEVCEYCIIADANGVDSIPLEEGDPQPLSLLEFGQFIIPNEHDHICEGHFSSTPCATCGQRLAGTRYCYLLLTPDGTSVEVKP